MKVTDSQRNPPAEIKPGHFSLVFDDVLEDDDEPFPIEITFTWDGERAASFVYDAWRNPSDPTFVAEVSSDPVYGWASWVDYEDVFIAFMHPMAEEEGWARVGSCAPGAGLDDPEAAMANPETWLRLATLIRAVAADKPVPDITRQTY
jgi:hypothetical protein